MPNPDLFDAPRKCGCRDGQPCPRHDPRMIAFRRNLLASIPSGKDQRTVIARIIPAIYPEDDIQHRGFEALDMEIREQIRVLKDEGHPVVTGRAGVWLCTTPQDMEDSFVQRIRHGATEIARVRKEAGSEMFSKLAGQCKLHELINQ